MAGQLACVILQFVRQADFVTSAPPIFLYTREARRPLKRVAGANSGPPIMPAKTVRRDAIGVPWCFDPATRAHAQSFFPIAINTGLPRSEEKMKSAKPPVETR